jgi:threonine aldolase
MRQAGILAAAGIHALEHHVKRLADDHANTRHLAEGLGRIPGIDLLHEPETNMVLFRVPDLPAFVARTRERGLLINPIDLTTLRAVTHLDVDAGDIREALEIIREVMT